MGKLSSFLKIYEDQDYTSRQKAKVLYIIILLILWGIGFLLFHSFFIARNNTPVFYIPMIITIPMMFFLLYKLKSGALKMVTTAITILPSFGVWITIFLEAPKNPQESYLVIYILSTMGFIYTQLIFTSLMSAYRKVFISLFFLINTGVLIIFAFHTKKKFGLPGNFVSEFLGDNIIAFTFIYLITMAIRSINENAFSKIQEESTRNKELSLTLEKRVKERTLELETAKEKAEEAHNTMTALQGQQMELARKAGMSDIASSVLHNVGNVLNSVVTSGDLVYESIRSSKVERLTKALKILKENEDNIKDFLLYDEKGVALFKYILVLEEILSKEHQELCENAAYLQKKIHIVTELIEAQRDYVYTSTIKEKININSLIQDALTILEEMINEYSIKVETSFNIDIHIPVHKTKTIHILLNLIKNSRDAFRDAQTPDPKILITTYQDDENLCIQFTDNGPGIKKELLDRIFQQGITTKKYGKGIGLHSCANYMKEMGGSISVESTEKKGTSFTIRFPAKA